MIVLKIPGRGPPIVVSEFLIVVQKFGFVVWNVAPAAVEHLFHTLAERIRSSLLVHSWFEDVDSSFANFIRGGTPVRQKSEMVIWLILASP